MSQHSHDLANWIGIFGTAWATVAGLLPPIAALVSIVWGLLQIFTWVERRRAKKGGRRKDDAPAE